MDLHELGKGDIAAAQQESRRVRRIRARACAQVASGELAAADVLCSDDPVLGRLRVGRFVRAKDGIGKKRSADLLGRLGISPDRTLRSLGCNQRRALIDELDGPPHP
ncbi:integration host factor, actinobacterial type [Senegalimassilia anaerobia]